MALSCHLILESLSSSATQASHIIVKVVEHAHTALVLCIATIATASAATSYQYGAQDFASAVTNHASHIQSVHRASEHNMYHHAYDSHTREKLLGGDALREGGVRQGLPCQAQLLPLHAAHPLEVASRYLHVFHTQFAPTAAVTGPLACAHGRHLLLGFCTRQVCGHLLAMLLLKSTVPALHMHGQGVADDLLISTKRNKL